MLSSKLLIGCIISVVGFCAAAASQTCSTLSVPASAAGIAVDNQGTPLGTVGPAFITLQVNVTPSTCHLTATASGNTVLSASGNNLTWFSLNAATPMCNPNSSGSSVASGTNSGSATVSICPNPVPGNSANGWGTPPNPIGAAVSAFDAAHSPLTPWPFIGDSPLPLALTGSILVTAGSLSQTVTVTSDSTKQVFTDVLPGAPYFDAINTLATRGIYTPPSPYSCTSGGGPISCALVPITRGEMAQWIIRAIFGSDNFHYSCSSTANPPNYESSGSLQTPCTAHFPTDCPAPAAVGGYDSACPYFPWIQAMYELGITNGCLSGSYCPNDPATRGEMAVFVERARFGGFQSFNYPGTAYFPTDCPASTCQFYPWIQRLAYDQITEGCAIGQFCPTANIDRADLAVFVARGLLNLQLASVANSPIQTNPPSPNPYLSRSLPLTAVATTASPANPPLNVYGVLPSGIASPTLHAVGCPYQNTGGACTTARWGAFTATLGSPTITYSPAPFANAEITATVTATFGGESSPNYEDVSVPQSLLLAFNPGAFPGGVDPRGALNTTYTGTLGGPPAGSAEVLIPNVLRVTDGYYANVGAPFSNNIPFTTWNTSWSPTMVAGSQAVERGYNVATQAPPYYQTVEDGPPGSPGPFPFFNDNGSTWASFPSSLTINMSQAVGEGTSNGLPVLTTHMCPGGAAAGDYNMTHPLVGSGALTYGYDYANFFVYEQQLPGNPTIYQSTGQGTFTPAAGAKGILFEGNFSGNTNTAPVLNMAGYPETAGIETYFLAENGCASVGNEYGIDTDFWNNPGVVVFYASQYTNCGSGPPPNCTDFNNNPEIQITAAQQIAFSAYPNQSAADLLASYFYSAYLVADSSPQGYRMRFEVSDTTGAYSPASCYNYTASSTTSQPCQFDIDIADSSENATLHFLDAYPQFFTNLFNGQGYILDDFDIEPGSGSGGYVWPNFTCTGVCTPPLLPPIFTVTTAAVAQ